MTQQSATAHCARKTVPMLTSKESELTCPYGTTCGHLIGCITNICCNCAVVLFHSLARIESEIKIFTLIMY